MTYNDFIIKLQEYYEPFKNAVVGSVMMKYIVDKFPENKLGSVFTKITLNYKYKNCPTPAILEEIFGDTLEVEALQAWEEINKVVDSYSSIIFSDIRLQFVIQSMGGWVEFCSRPNDHKNEVWAQKRFIELYKLYTYDKPGGGHLPLQGRYKGFVKSDLGNLIMFGDKEKCKQLADRTALENKIDSNIKKIN